MGGRRADQVVVITGGSSGIGRASALTFARKGASVVVCGRDPASLDATVRECERMNGSAVAVTADVTREEDVQRVARTAVERFGRIDVWVNNAAVTMFGRVEDVPMEAYRRVIETNVLGYVHGARAVIPYMRKQGSGVLINVSSVAGTLGQPYTAAYVTSKWAIRGFSESLRQELIGTGIAVATVLPASIDTPIYQHGANFHGRLARPMTPVYRPEKVARAIVRCAAHPRREVMVGNAGRISRLLRTVWPALFERSFAWQVARKHFLDNLAAPTVGNLYAHQPPTGTSGGWQRNRPWRLVAAAMVIGPLVLALAARKPRRVARFRQRAAAALLQ